MVQTRSQVKLSGLNLPEVHGVGKDRPTCVARETNYNTSSFKSKRNFTNKPKVRTRESRIKMQNKDSD